MTRILVLLLITLLACSETENRPIPEPPAPTISISGSRARGTGRRPVEPDYIVRSASFWIESDIPMPRTTYILISDQFVRMAEGEIATEVVFEKSCPYDDFAYSAPKFEATIKPMHERPPHLPYHVGTSICAKITSSARTRLANARPITVTCGAHEK